MRLLIVIVNYRTADLVVDCLRSLAAQVDRANMRVVVTDNQSGDDSVARLTNAVTTNGWGDWCAIRALDHNGGFAYGNNAGIAQALQLGQPPRYVLLLNPDTVVRDGAIAALAAFMDAHPDAG